MRLGKIQIKDLFAHYGRNSLDDSEFIPPLDTLIESFARAGLTLAVISPNRRIDMDCYRVSPLVNNARNDSPECLKPA